MPVCTTCRCTCTFDVADCAATAHKPCVLLDGRSMQAVRSHTDQYGAKLHLIIRPVSEAYRIPHPMAMSFIRPGLLKSRGLEHLVECRALQVRIIIALAVLEKIYRLFFSDATITIPNDQTNACREH